MSATLTVRQVDQVTVVDAAGRITLNEGAGPMRDKISELLRTGKSKILVNLGEVSYIDSAAICELVAALTFVTNRGGQLKLLNLTKEVERLLQITKLYTVFDVFDSQAFPPGRAEPAQRDDASPRRRNQSRQPLPHAPVPG